jgi:ABC-type amino acid transport substrate-binding protein
MMHFSSIQKSPFFGIILFTLFFAGNSSLSAQTLNCATTHYPPFTIFDDATNKFSGLDMDIVNPVFKNLNIKLKVANLPWARLKNEIELNKFDCYFSVGKFTNREVFLDYTDVPTHITKIAIFFRQSDDKFETNFSDKVVGIHRGINLHRDIPQKYGIHSSKLHQLPSNDVLFEMLERGRLDVVVTSKDVGEYILQKQHSQLEIEKLVIDDYQLPVYLAFRKGVIDVSRVNSELIKVINSTSLPSQPE